MNRKISELKSFLKNKKVAVLGVGISNKPLIKFISKYAAKITAFDMADENDAYIQMAKQEFEKEGITLDWSLGHTYLDKLQGFDIIFKTPKVRVDLPQLIEERNNGAIITSEMEVFMECCPCKIIAVTGSDGKTTTTTMISLLLKESGYEVHVGGNIGTPLLDQINEIKETDIVVLELSSFQLHSMRKSPDIAVITNISPNHLDVHKDYEEYIDAKKNVFRFQSMFGKLVLNYNNEITREFSKEARGNVTWFNKINPEGYYFDKKTINFPENNAIPRNEIKVVGSHNAENYCAAIAAVGDMVSKEAIQKVFANFNGVEHRIEFVREINNVSFYNSSIDSSPTRTKATLKAFADFGKRVVIISGGKDKNSDYTGLGDAMLEVSNKIILCGENSNLIKESIDEAFKNLENSSYSKKPTSGDDNLIIYIADSYEDAVKKSVELADQGEAVVLTPAGTSFDRFRNFEERGNTFKNIVQSLNL